jgi:regulator of protease activity HflC (stomatin/prohibitin superfamily)
MFENIDAEYFQHGNINYIMPQTGKVAICYRAGQLEILEPSSTGKPYIVDDPTFSTNSKFLDTTLQTLIFPSDEAQAKHKKDGRSSEETPYEVVMTIDSVRIGVKLLVAYRIINAKLAISQIKQDEIKRHIESVTIADMTRCVQRCTSQQFMHSNKSTPDSKSVHDPNVERVGTVPDYEEKTIQDEIRDRLAEDLEKYGIKLVRMNFEEAIFLNKEILNALQAQAMSTAKTNSEVAQMEQKFQIAQKQARQEAEVTTSKAKAAADAKLLDAEADAKALEIRAIAEAKAILAKAQANAEAAELQASILQKYPASLEARLAEIRASMMNKATFFVAPAEFTNMMGSMELAKATKLNVMYPAGQMNGVSRHNE